jgi:hypothetical protein
MTEPRAIAQCPVCKQPVRQGESFLCFKKPNGNAYLFIHYRRFTEGEDCSEIYFRSNGGATPLFEIEAT